MRLFFAISFDGPAQDDLHRAAAALARVKTRGHVTAPENLHLTLAFLGEQPEAAGSALCAAATRAAGAPFFLTLGESGRFRQARGDVWWIGTQPCPPLEALVRRLRRELEQAGFSPDPKPFRAHVTLGRGVALPPDAAVSACTARQEVRRFTLFSSAREHGALVYAPVAHIPLPPGAGTFTKPCRFFYK